MGAILSERPLSLHRQVATNQATAGDFQSMRDARGPLKDADGMTVAQLRSYNEGVSAHSSLGRAVRRARARVHQVPSERSQYIAILDTDRMPAVEVALSPDNDPEHYDMYGNRNEMIAAIFTYVPLADHL